MFIDIFLHGWEETAVFWGLNLRKRYVYVKDYIPIWPIPRSVIKWFDDD